MTTLAPQALASTTAVDHHDSHPVRAVVRSAAVLVVALGLTTAVLVALASVMEGWA